jgi:hypothetical protein
MIIALRKKSTRLAVSYIRLTRALETGYTLGYPEFSDDPKTLTMGDLREQFHQLLVDIANMDHAETGSSDQDEKWFETELRRAEVDPHLRQDRITFADTAIDEQIQAWLDSSGADEDSVTVEDFDWESGMTEADVKKAFEDVLNEDVLKAHDDKVKKLLSNDQDTPAKTLDKILKASDDSANLGGGIVDKGGIDAGRDVINQVWNGDKRVAAYARVCRPGACAFCALMAARGFVYKSRYSAGDPSTTNRYHNHCHCYVILRYVDTPTLPAQNEYWKAAYKREVTDKGYTYTPATSKRAGVNNALNAWRRWLNQQRRADGTYDPKNR